MNGEQTAKIRFNAIEDYASLEALIDIGQAEDLFYECKAPSQPKLGQDQRVQLAEAVSGFSNAEGGVLIYGIETSKIRGVDVMQEITKVGTAYQFASALTNMLPTLTIPAVTKFEHRVITETPGASAGVVVVYIPSSKRPVQSVLDNKFHFRAGDQFVTAPYSTIERLFAAVDSPDLTVSLEGYKYIPPNSTHTRGAHHLSAVLANGSLASAKDTKIWMRVLDANAIESFVAPGMSDVSDVNNTKLAFTRSVNEAVHHKLGLSLDEMTIVMKPRKRKLRISLTVYADRMTPKAYEFTCVFNTNSLASISAAELEP